MLRQDRQIEQTEQIKKYEQYGLKFDKHLDQALKRALEKAGIHELNELQKKAYFAISSGKNILIIAPTGSGKTESAIIPIFEKIYSKNLKGIALLYITPLRALNRDMLRRFEIIASELNLSVAVRHGDTEEGERRKQSLKPPQVLITTPETFQLLLIGKRLRESLKNVRFLVIDEVHELADNERGVQLSIAIERLREIAKFQTIALSATISDEKTILEFFKCDDVIKVDINKEYDFQIIKPKANDEISHILNVNPEIAGELDFIRELVEKHKSVLIFVNTRQTAEALGVKLKKMVDVEVHHGSLSKEVRIESERKFANRKLKALICTSSMELGIDIGHVDAVIQYNSPREVTRLLQRVGRSGHGIGKVSKGYIIASSFDELLESAIIVDLAYKGEMEKLEVHEKSIDTLVNQIAGIVLEYGRINAYKVYEIVKRSYPYRNLTEDEFKEVLSFMNDVNLIRYDGEEISPLRKTRKYFFDNISMIPDEKHYRVKDIISGKTIGVLDEQFLQTFDGELIAMKGEVWRVVGIDDYVKVIPASSEGDVPSWVGEEIPVPFEVAEKVGKIRNFISERINSKDLYDYLKRFRLNDNAIECIVQKIREHIRKGFEVPGEKVVVEGDENSVIINVCKGHKVNETIGRVVALLLSTKYARNVAIEIDPYRVKLMPAKREDVVEIMSEVSKIDFQGFKSLVERALIDTKLFQWKILNCARKMGYLKKDAETGRINLRKFALKLVNSLIYKEAMREIFIEKLDVKKAYEFFKDLNRYEIISYSSYTPIGLSSHNLSFDLFQTKNEEAILDLFLKRIENELTYFVCLNCRYSVRLRVYMIEDFRCPRCKSVMVAILSARRELEKYSDEELYKSANLIRMYGKRAVYALNTYGIGVNTAARILSGFYPNEREFLKQLLNEEKRYIRTRKFWE